MGTYYSSGYSNVQRPRPTTYEQAREQEAQDYYDSQRQRVEGDTTSAGQNRSATTAAAGKALADYQAGGSPALASYNTQALSGYDPSQVASWMAANTVGPAPQRSAVPQVSGGGVNFSSTNLAGFDPSALMGFDPSAYGKEYAQGAYGDFQRNLNDELEQLTNASVGAGRLRTGLFDEDQGRVVTRNAATFADKLAQAATTFSGQKLAALQGGSQLQFNRAQAMDENARAIAELNAQLGLEASKANASNALSGQELDLRGYGLETDRQGLALQAARSADELGLQRATDLDRLALQRAQSLDTNALQRSSTGLDAALSRERLAQQGYDTARDRESDFASASRDYAARDREMADLRAEIARLRQLYGANQGTTSASPGGSLTPGIGGGFKNAVTGPNGAGVYW